MLGRYLEGLRKDYENVASVSFSKRAFGDFVAVSDMGALACLLTNFAAQTASLIWQSLSAIKILFRDMDSPPRVELEITPMHTTTYVLIQGNVK